MSNIIIGFFTLSMAFILYVLVEPHFYQTKRYTIPINQEGLKGLKIVFLSDFHHSEIVSQKAIKKIIKRVNPLHPDLILLGGDYVSHQIQYIEPLFNLLKELKAPLGIYGVLGNHDHEVSKDLVLQGFVSANIHLLDNASFWIPYHETHFKLGGVGDYLFDQQNLEPTLSGLKDSDFTILVSHNPDYIEEVKGKPIDLMLSGHTHGGQVTLFGLYAPYIPSKYKNRYRSGLKRVGHTSLIVSNGVGEVGMPIRFFARPQIILIELV